MYIYMIRTQESQAPRPPPPMVWSGCPGKAWRRKQIALGERVMSSEVFDIIATRTILTKGSSFNQ